MPPAVAPTAAPLRPPATAPMSVPAPALPPMMSASFSHDRFCACGRSGLVSTTAGARVTSSRFARSLTSTGCRPLPSRMYTPCGSLDDRAGITNCALRPSASVTGTTIPSIAPSGVGTVSAYAPPTPYCCSTFSGVIAWVSRPQADAAHSPARVSPNALAYCRRGVLRMVSAPLLTS